MYNFIRGNKKTILFIVVVVLILGGIFTYRTIKRNTGSYAPNVDDVHKEIIKYEDNEYVIYNIRKEDVYRSYYRDFMNLLLNDPTKAYNKLYHNTKQDKFNNNYDNFLKFVKSLDKKTLMTSDVTRYSDEDNRIIVVDSTGASYVFYENGVWNYTVDINVRG